MFIFHYMIFEELMRRKYKIDLIFRLMVLCEFVTIA
jgi:hypothetical protein